MRRTVRNRRAAPVTPKIPAHHPKKLAHLDIDPIRRRTECCARDDLPKFRFLPVRSSRTGFLFDSPLAQGIFLLLLNGGA